MRTIDCLGGPAYPVVIGKDELYYGLSARDYFAAHAPITLADSYDHLYRMFGQNKTVKHGSALNQLVRMRFEYADAMLAERAK